MGQRGPKTTPTQVLQLRGSRHAKGRREPAVALGIPTAPDYLSPAAQPLWEAVTGLLRAAGLLTQVDGHQLGRYCVLHARWRRMLAHVEAHGEVEVQEAGNGGTKRVPTPEARLMREYHADLARIEASFGMTPSARASLGAALGQAAAAEGKADKSRFFRTL